METSFKVDSKTKNCNSVVYNSVVYGIQASATPIFHFAPDYTRKVMSGLSFYCSTTTLEDSTMDMIVFVNRNQECRPEYLLLLERKSSRAKSEAGRETSPIRSRMGCKYARMKCDTFAGEDDDGHVAQGAWIADAYVRSHGESEAINKAMSNSFGNSERPKEAFENCEYFLLG
uniref:Peptidase M12A domain-containing protein n=1 Tax=Steinernema glaseri TaxID=37863 RepID=A0A1I7Y8D7_9BILA